MFTRPDAKATPLETAPPAKKPSAAPTVLPPADAASPASEPQRKRRILFVVGDTGVSEEFSRALQARTQSYEVAAATSAAEAISLLEANLFDCGLASARLPGSTGVDFLNGLARRFPHLVRLIRYAPED